MVSRTTALLVFPLILFALAGCGRRANQTAATAPSSQPVAAAPATAPMPNPEPVAPPYAEPAPAESAPVAASTPSAGPAAPALAMPAPAPAAGPAPGPYSAPQTVASAEAPAPVPAVRQTFIIAAGTRIRVRLAQRIDTKRSYAGERFLAHLDEPLVVGYRVVVPKGAPVQGHVIEARPSGRLRGRAQLALTLDSLEWNGQRYPIATAVYGRVSSSHRKRNFAFIGGGSAGGAVVGAAAGGGLGALIGAGAGAGAGTVGALVTGRKNVSLPPETQLSFVLREPVRIHS